MRVYSVERELWDEGVRAAKGCEYEKDQEMRRRWSAYEHIVYELWYECVEMDLWREFCQAALRGRYTTDREKRQKWRSYADIAYQVWTLYRQMYQLNNA